MVPRQQVAGERQSQHDLHQDEAEPEIDLARRTVRAVDHHLHKVERQQHDHRVGHEVVHAAQQPAARHLVLDVVDALPGGLRAGAVRGPQHHAGDDLHEEAEHQRAAPDVAPARAAGNVFVERVVHERAVAGAMVQPIEEAAHPIGILSAMPVRNRCKPTQISCLAVVVDELHRQRIEAAEARPEQFLAVLGERAGVARALELAGGGVEVDGAAQVRAGAGKGGDRLWAVGRFGRA